MGEKMIGSHFRFYILLDDYSNDSHSAAWIGLQEYLSVSFRQKDNTPGWKH